jgi:hypothetical protein
LLNSINAYIEKTDIELEENLEEEGFAEAKYSVDKSSELENDLTNILIAEVYYFVSRLKTSGSVKNFFSLELAGVMFDSTAEKKIAETFNKYFSDVVPHLSEIYFNRIDKELQFTKVSKKTLAWIDEWSAELGRIIKLSSHNVLQKYLHNGFEKGLTIEEVTKHITDKSIRESYIRARTVALTETLRAHSVAQQESFLQSPAVTKKMWVHTSRHKERENHKSNPPNGQIVNVEEPFIIYGIKGGTYYPLYPRDNNLPPEESINCRCAMKPVLSDEVSNLPLKVRKKLHNEIKQKI